MRLILLFTLLILNLFEEVYGFPLPPKPVKKIVALNKFGAVGNSVTDDTQAISKALNSTITIGDSKKFSNYYRVTNTIIVKNLNKKIIFFKNTKILNSDLTKATFLFQNCRNVEIQGGTYGYSTRPTANGGNSQHVFQFDNCQNVVVNGVHVVCSPEMGIAITNCNNVVVKNSLIEHTFRDGTYAHYSSNVSYLNNTYKHIKDDAMSFHDYGINAEKNSLRKYGYQQATNFTAQGNRVENAYQGLSSISASNIKILSNKIRNTVNAGIAVFNSTELFAAGTALVNRVLVRNNTVEKSCNDITINNIAIKNNGQASTGRAAIFIGSLGKNNQLNAGETKRLKNVIVEKNRVVDSGADGFVGNKIDGLVLEGNTFINCSGQVLAKSLEGDVVELSDLKNFMANNNTVIDNRAKTLHRHAYSINGVSGKMGNWHIKNVLEKKNQIINSNQLTITTVDIK